MEFTDEARTQTTQTGQYELITFSLVPLGQPQIVDLGIGFGHLEGIQLRIAVTIMTILEVLVIVSNVVVVATIRHHRQLRTTTSLYIISLAISDLCCGLGMPIGLLAKYIPDLFLYSVYVCIAPFCLLLTVLASAILNLLAVSVDRYIALKNPLRYGAIMTKRRSRMLIIMVWTFSLIMGSIPLLWHHKETYTPHSDTGYCQWYRVVTQGYMIIYTTIILAVPIVIILGIHINIFRIARSHAKSIDTRTRIANSMTSASSVLDTTAVNTSSHHTRRKNLSDTESVSSMSSRTRLSRISLESRVAITIGMIVFSFAVCWMPLAITLLLGVLCDECDVSPEVRGWLGLVALVNSFCDPFIYTIRTKDFRIAFKEMLFRSKEWCLTKMCHQLCATAYSTAPRSSKSSISTIVNAKTIYQEEPTTQDTGCQAEVGLWSGMNSNEAISRSTGEFDCEQDPINEDVNLEVLTPL